MKNESSKELSEAEIERILNPDKAGLRRFQFGLRQFMLVWIASGVIVGAGCIFARVLKNARDLDGQMHFASQYAAMLVIVGVMIWFCTILVAIAILIKTRFAPEQRKKFLRSLATIYLAGLLVTFTPPFILMVHLLLTGAV